MFGATWQTSNGLLRRRAASTGRPRPKIAKTSASTATTTSARSSAGSSASGTTPAWPAVRFRCRHRHRRRRQPPAAARTRSTVDAQCNPCTVEVGATSNVTATAQGFDRLRHHLSVERADRHVRESGAAEHRVDGAEHARHRAGHGHRHLPDRQHEGVRHGEHPGRAARREDDYVRRRVLRLRPLHVDRRGAAHSGAGGGQR